MKVMLIIYCSICLLMFYLLLSSAYIKSRPSQTALLRRRVGVTRSWETTQPGELNPTDQSCFICSIKHGVRLKNKTVRSWPGGVVVSCLGLVLPESKDGRNFIRYCLFCMFFIIVIIFPYFSVLLNCIYLNP